MSDFLFQREAPGEDEFVHDFAPWEVDEGAVHLLFAKTQQAYRSRERFYHTLEHIGQIFRVIDHIIEGGSSLTREKYHILRLAGWFHDVVYDPRRNDNEEQSALWAERELIIPGLSREIIQEISQLILATRSHIASLDDLSTHILLDADLAILGAAPDIYNRYAQAIRQEYAFVPDAVYRTGRQAVLEKFLSRTQIYHTRLYEVLEIRARANLRNEIRLLSQPTPFP